MIDESVMQGEWIGSLDGLYFDQDRIAVTSGRMADPSRVDEIVVSESMAQLAGYRVGQQLDVGVFDDEEISQSDGSPGSLPAPKDRISIQVVGIGVFTDEVVQDEVDRIPRVLVTPALTERERPLATYAWTGLRLRDGAADVPAVKEQYLTVLPPGYPHFFRDTAVVEAQGQRAIRPQAVALGVFGVIALLATLLLGGQALGRQLRLERDDLDQLRASGAGPGVLSTQGLFGAALVIVLGVGLAVVVAVALSPLTPIGPVRRIEVDPGVSIDPLVLGLGAAAISVVFALVAVVVAWRQAPHRVARRHDLRSNRQSVIVHAASAAGLGVAAVTGVRQAVQRSSTRSAVPSRSVVIGATVAILAMVTALTFAASLDSLVSHPRLFGWDWDEMLLASSGYGNLPQAATDEMLGSDPDVEAWTGISFGSLELDGVNIPVIGGEVDAPVHPPMLSGRTIETDDEVVLGVATLDQLHKSVGDQVTLSGESGPVTLPSSARPRCPRSGSVTVRTPRWGPEPCSPRRRSPGTRATSPNRRYQDPMRSSSASAPALTCRWPEPSWPSEPPRWPTRPTASRPTGCSDPPRS